tara:strand:+ start:201 stop:575 length:375 start_codon:yes stop_codon:yes gene_type:complete
MILKLGIFALADLIAGDQYANWTRSGALTIAQWLDECMPELEPLDLAQIRGQFSEYKSFKDFADQQWGEADAIDRLGITKDVWDEEEGDAQIQELNEAARKLLAGEAMFLEHDEGVIIETITMD